MIHNFSSSEIREILQNSAYIKKDCMCIYCMGTGFIHYDFNGENISYGYAPSNKFVQEECDKCGGIGFILKLR